MQQRHAPLIRRGLLAGAVAFGLATCQPGPGGIGNSTEAAMPELQADARGVIAHPSYQIAVARDGDTVASVADRVGGVSAAELARLNGLPGDHRLRQG
ncbi:hypothetical protein BH23PSE1_BH23PSE1_05150 [soil metagenome]